MPSSPSKTIFVPASLCLHRKDHTPAPKLAEVRALLEAEYAKGTRIVIDSPIRNETPGGLKILYRWLLDEQIPYSEIGDCADPSITHYLIGTKLVEVLP